jgi:two-component system response regulator
VKEINILLVEDNLDHAKLIELILIRKNVRAHVHVVRDGVEAMTHLFHHTLVEKARRLPRPDLILLDLNMPRVDGRELLRRLKSDRVLRDVPVIVVSTSEREQDKVSASRDGAVGYISKSAGFDVMSEMLARVTDFAELERVGRLL